MQGQLYSTKHVKKKTKMLKNIVKCAMHSVFNPLILFSLVVELKYKAFSIVSKSTTKRTYGAIRSKSEMILNVVEPLETRLKIVPTVVKPKDKSTPTG